MLQKVGGNAIMKKSILVLCLFFGVVLGFLGLNHRPLMASGTYTPPPPPKFKGKSVDMELMKRAETLLNEPKSFSEKELSCMSCHEKKGNHPFTRRNLFKIKDALVEPINACLTNPDRMNGKPLGKDDEAMKLLEMYFFVKYRL